MFHSNLFSLPIARFSEMAAMREMRGSFISLLIDKFITYLHSNESLSHPERSEGYLNWFQIPNSAKFSLMLFINCIFLFLVQPFSCFSRLIASIAELYSSI